MRIRSELLYLVGELPGIFLKVAQTLQADDVVEAMQHYAQFVTSTSSLPATASAKDLLPTLTEVCKADLAAEVAASQGQKGNDREVATGSNEQGGAAALTGSPETTAQSLGLSGAEKAATQEVDGSLPGNAPEEISWDIDLAAVEDVMPDDAASGGGKDWDIDLAETAQAGEDEKYFPGHANGEDHPAQGNSHAGEQCWQAGNVALLVYTSEHLLMV